MSGNGDGYGYGDGYGRGYGYGYGHGYGYGNGNGDGHGDGYGDGDGSGNGNARHYASGITRRKTMEAITQDLIGARVLIRSSDSGVHHGTLRSVSGTSVRLTDSRRLWEWSTGGTGISLSEVAICGVSHDGSKITMAVPDMVIGGACEIIPTHGMCDATIDGAAVYKP